MTEPEPVMAQAEQDQLTRQVGRALLTTAGADWQQVRAEYRSAGRHIEVDVFVKGPDGVERPVRPPQEVVDGLGRLRQGMYRPGRGTWLSALYVLDPPSAFSAEFEPDVEPHWRRIPPPIGFADELRFFPRGDEHIPDWLRQRAGLPPAPGAQDSGQGNAPAGQGGGPAGQAPSGGPAGPSGTPASPGPAGPGGQPTPGGQPALSQPGLARQPTPSGQPIPGEQPFGGPQTPRSGTHLPQGAAGIPANPGQGGTPPHGFAAAPPRVPQAAEASAGDTPRSGFAAQQAPAPPGIPAGPFTAPQNAQPQNAPPAPPGPFVPDDEKR